MVEFKHKCKEWNLDVQIHPGCNWVFGTCMWFFKGKWMLLDEKSETFSTYGRDVCPCCMIKFEEILKNEANQ